MPPANQEEDPPADRRPARGDAGADQPRRQRRAQAHRPRLRAPLHRHRAGHGPPGGPDPPGLLLRHPRPSPQPGRRGRAGPPGPGPRRRHRRQAPPHRPRPAAPECPQGQDHGRGGRRHARRLCLLGLLQGRPRPRHRRQGGRGRRPGDPQAVLQGAAGLLRHPRPRGAGPGRPDGPGADQRDQAEVHPQGPQAAAGGRAVAVPGRGADPGAVDQVRPQARASRSPPRCRAFLADRGVDLYGEQQTKTKTALDFFAKSLQAGAASR